MRSLQLDSLGDGRVNGKIGGRESDQKSEARCLFRAANLRACFVIRTVYLALIHGPPVGLWARASRFVVLPGCFVVHWNHPPTKMKQVQSLRRPLGNLPGWAP